MDRLCEGASGVGRGGEGSEEHPRGGSFLRLHLPLLHFSVHMHADTLKTLEVNSLFSPLLSLNFHPHRLDGGVGVGRMQRGCGTLL